MRFELSGGGKKFVPFRRDPDGWRMKDPPGKLPPYHLAELVQAPVVWVLEGEKCADLARDRAGLTATTSSHGSGSAAKTDWSALAGKTVYLIPDHDAAGEKYMATVGAILAGLEPKPIIKVVRLPLVNDGDDIEQWLESVPDSWGPDECRAGLERLAAAAPEWTAAPIETATAAHSEAAEVNEAADDPHRLRGFTWRSIGKRGFRRCGAIGASGWNGRPGPIVRLPTLSCWPGRRQRSRTSSTG